MRATSTSGAGLNMIGMFEGCVLHVYRDPIGLPTIGIGHLVHPEDNLSLGQSITKQRAYELLAQDVKKCETALNRHIVVELNQNEFDALVSLGFNCGTGLYQSSALAILLNRGDRLRAADEFPKWCKAGGKVHPGLQARRKEERRVFLTPCPETATATESLETVIERAISVQFDLTQLLDFMPHRVAHEG